MKQKIQELIKKLFEERAEKVFTVEYRDAQRSYAVNYLSAEKYGPIEDYELTARLQQATNYTITLQNIKHVREDYGFANGIFCHASKMVGTTHRFNEMDNEQLFIINSIETEKGRKATWFVPFELMDEKTEEIVKDVIFNIFKQRAENACCREVDRAYAAAAEYKKNQQLMQKIGCKATIKYTDNWRQGYQNQYLYKIEAEKPLNYFEVLNAIKILKGENALSTERIPYYTEPKNRICTTEDGALCSWYDDTKAISNTWYWYRHDGTCD